MLKDVKDAGAKQTIAAVSVESWRLEIHFFLFSKAFKKTPQTVKYCYMQLIIIKQ